jgi:GNAT superfamily N-acetyltransferase
LKAAEYVATVQRMMKDGFRLAAVLEGGTVRAVAGYRFAESLAWGRYLYVDDLVTDEAVRSRGDGRLLLDWLVKEATRAGCRELHLDSGVQRHGAHRFYLRERMDIVAYHFKLDLS